jgi:hypothetical protein
MAPPFCPYNPYAPPINAYRVLEVDPFEFTFDIWSRVGHFLSYDDLKNLRLTCLAFSQNVGIVMVRSVVAKFDKTMFTSKPNEWVLKRDGIQADSMFGKFGSGISQFGISFEVDLDGLAEAPPKTIEKLHHTWWGTYKWPQLPAIYPLARGGGHG